MDFGKFKKDLDLQLEQICSDKKWDKTPSNKGKAFEIWLARALHEKFSASSNSDSDFDPEDYVQASNDLKLDIVIPRDDEIYLIQAKYGAFSDEDVKNFFQALVFALDEQYISPRTKNNVRRDAFTQLRKHKNTGRGAIKLWFFAKNKASDACMESLGVYKRRCAGTNVDVDIFDLEAIMELLQEEHEPVDTEFPLEKGCWFQPPVQAGKQHRNITLWLKGSVIRKLLEDYGEIRVFNKNIRTTLGSPLKPTSVNEEVVKTLVYEPDKFFYYNNGISAICQEYTVDEEDNRLVIKGLQIINGAQTCGSLFADQFTDKEKKKRGEKKHFYTNEEIAQKAEEAQILVKLTEIKDMKDDDDFTSKIVRYNNTQNAVTPQDFRSNDPIQKWLKSAFKEFEIYYHIKRPYKDKRGKTNIRIGDFAKVWLSWRKDLPWETSEIPRLMKDDVFVPHLTEEVSFYEHIFGKKDIESWERDELLQAVIAVRSFKKILASIKSFDKEAEQKRQLDYLKYFALCLFKIYLEKKKAVSKKDAQFYEDWIKDEPLSERDYENFGGVMIKTIKQIYDRNEKKYKDSRGLERDRIIYDDTKKLFEKNLKSKLK